LPKFAGRAGVRGSGFGFAFDAVGQLEQSNHLAKQVVGLLDRRLDGLNDCAMPFHLVAESPKLRLQSIHLFTDQLHDLAIEGLLPLIPAFVLIPAQHFDEEMVPSATLFSPDLRQAGVCPFAQVKAESRIFVCHGCAKASLLAVAGGQVGQVNPKE
jgi:hypothetical protein